MYFEHYLKYRGKDRFAGPDGRLGRFRDYLTVPEMMEILHLDGSEEVASRPRPQRRRRA
jgi:hypothetical protein